MLTAEKLFDVWRREADAGNPLTVDDLTPPNLDAEQVTQLRQRIAAEPRRSPMGTVLPDRGVALPEGYLNLGCLGEGGYGRVFKALRCRDAETVAVKLIDLPSAPDAQTELRRRFRRECDALRVAVGRHVVALHEFGEFGGHLFLVMEYCPGGTLSARLAGGARIEPDEAVGLLVGIACGVAAAHDVHVVHRDLKPGNVLFAAPPGDSLPVAGWLNWVPKVADFGLAKPLGDDVSADADGPTKSGQFVGTYAYMSPEQARREPATARADVWALGVLLYQCLTGANPFASSNLDETFRRIQTHDPRRPAGIAAALWRICERCLEKRAHRRYATATELLADLTRYQKGQPIGGRWRGLLRRGRRLARSRRVRWGAGIGALLALVVAGAVLWPASAPPVVVEVPVPQPPVVDPGKPMADYLSRIQQAELVLAAGKPDLARKSLDACPAELRGWEWRYLDAQLADGLLRTVGDTVAFVPGPGLRLLVGSEGKPLELIDAFTGKPAVTLAAAAPALNIAASPDGTWVAATFGTAAKVWKTADGTVRAVPIPADVAGPNAQVVAVAFSPTGDRLAVSVGRAVLVYAVADLSVAVRVPSQPFPVWSVAFHPDGGALALAGGGNTAVVWDMVRNVERCRTEATDGRTVFAEFSPDGNWFATGDDGNVRVWDARTGKAVKALDTNTKNVSRVAFSPDGTQLLAGCESGEVVGWDIHTLKQIGRSVLDMVPIFGERTWAKLRVPFRHQQPVTALAYSPDGQLVATAGLDGAARVIARPDDGQPFARSSAESDVPLSRDGKKAAVNGGADVRVYDLTARRPGPALTLGDGRPAAARRVWLSDDGGRVVLELRERGELALFDATTGRQVGRTIPAPRSMGILRRAGGRNDQLIFLPHAPAFLLDTGAEVCGYDSGTGEKSFTVPYPANRERPGFVVCAPDGRHVLLIGDGLTVVSTRDGKTVYRAATPLPVPTTKDPLESFAFVFGDLLLVRPVGTEAPVSVVSLSLGQPIASLPVASPLEVRTGRTTQRGAIVTPTGAEVWQLGNGEKLFDLAKVAAATTATVRAVAVSADGTRLAVGRSDGAVEIWDIDAARKTASGTGPLAPSGLAFTDDGRRLAVLSAAEQVVKLLDADTGATVLTLPTAVGPAITGPQRPTLAFEFVTRAGGIDEVLSASGPYTPDLPGRHPTRWATTPPDARADDLFLRVIGANGWHAQRHPDDRFPVAWRDIVDDFPAAFHAGRAAAADPTNWERVDASAVAWHRLGQTARAAPLFRAVLKLDGVPGTVRRSAMIALGDWAAAAEHASARLRSGNTEEADWVDLGLIRLRFGDVDGFRAHCREFRKRWGEANPRVVLLYCLHPDAADDAKPAWDAALAGLKAWREKPQPDNGFTKAIARLLYRMERYDDCAAAFAVREANWQSGDPDDWLFRGRAELRRGQSAEAKKWLTKPAPEFLPMVSNWQRLDWQRRDTLRVLKWEAEADIMRAAQ